MDDFHYFNEPEWYVISRPYSKRESRNTALIFKIYRATGRVYTYPPVKKNLSRWCRKDSWLPPRDPSRKKRC